MTDVASETLSDRADESAPRLVKMRRFGPGEGSTLPISLVSGAVILALWWIVAELHLVPHLFLPTPGEVWRAAVSIYQDGYANASLFEHVSASLLRIFTAGSHRHRVGRANRSHHGAEQMGEGRFRYADRVLLAAAAARLSAADDHLARHRRDFENHAPGACDVRADRSLRPGRRSLGLPGAGQRCTCRSGRRAFSSCARSCFLRRCRKS